MVSYKRNLYREIFIMELIGKLKQKAENAAGKEEARKLIEQASVKMTDTACPVFSALSLNTATISAVLP